jgi:adenylylsulfate kinase-like enzyme
MKYSLFLLAAASLWCAEESSRTIEKSFPLTGNARRVQVCMVSGAMKVTASDGNEVRFTIREKISASSRDRLEELKKETDVVFAQEAGIVRAGVKGPWASRECGSSQTRNENRRKWDS